MAITELTVTLTFKLKKQMTESELSEFIDNNSIVKLTAESKKLLSFNTAPKNIRIKFIISS
jgi:hypothetical protein